jgi:hypothetical protein
MGEINKTQALATSADTSTQQAAASARIAADKADAIFRKSLRDRRGVPVRVTRLVDAAPDRDLTQELDELLGSTN